MKKMYFLIAVFFAACASSLSVKAQTDVTATYLTNPGFDVSCNYLITTASSNLASGSTNNQTINGWTLTGSAANTASSTFEYGYAGTLNLSGTAYGFIPTQGPDAATGTGHGALGISVAWGMTVTYYQTVTLPAGKYKLKYAAYNSGPATLDNSKVGWVPASGTSALSAKTAFTMAAWDKDSVSFTVTAPTTGNIQVGLTAPGSGSPTVGRIFFDYVKLIALPVDKTTLLQLKDSATVMYNSQKPVGTSTVYADLNTVIASAQLVYNDPSATAAQVLGQQGALQTAMTNVYTAIMIQSRISTWTPLPYDATSVIVNPSFESAISTGWTNVGGFAQQTNSSFAKMVGKDYVEKYVATSASTPGVLSGLKLSQTITNIPNGIYLLTASAQAIQQATTTFPGGAYIIANNDSTEVFAVNDYSVITKVTNNTLNIGFKVNTTGNWIALDNFRLSYVSDGSSPYVVLTPSSLFFDANNLTKTISVGGGNLTSNLVLSAPAGITLDQTTLTPTQVAAGATVTATFDNATAITNGAITATSGTATQSITVNASADLSCFTPLYPALTNLIPNPYLNDISAFGGWGHKAVVLGGAYCGAACVEFTATTNTYPEGAALDVSNIAWAANHTYRFRAMVKAVDGTFAFLANGTNPNVLHSVPMSGDNWVTVDTTFVVGASPTTSFFTFNNVDGASTGRTAYIDNYELYDITSILTGVNQVATNGFNAYVTDKKIVAKFDLESTSNVTLSVYSVSGLLLESQKATCEAGANVKTLTNVLSSGVYIVKMTVNGRSMMNKIVL